MALIGLLLLSVGGLGGFILRQLRDMAADTRKKAPEPARDRIAELERLVETYRGEVRDVIDRTDRWFQRAAKRQERDSGNSTDLSTGNPPSVVESKAELRRRLFVLRHGGR